MTSGHSLWRERHKKLRAAKFRAFVEDGAFYDSRTASRWSRARPTPSSVSAAGASARFYNRAGVTRNMKSGFPRQG